MGHLNLVLILGIAMYIGVVSSYQQFRYVPKRPAPINRIPASAPQPPAGPPPPRRALPPRRPPTRIAPYPTHIAPPPPPPTRVAPRPPPPPTPKPRYQPTYYYQPTPPPIYEYPIAASDCSCYYDDCPKNRYKAGDCGNEASYCCEYDY